MKRLSNHRNLYSYFVPFGQGLVEYGMIIILVAILVLVLLAIFGESVVGFLYSNIVASI